MSRVRKIVYAICGSVTVTSLFVFTSAMYGLWKVAEAYAENAITWSI